MNSQKYIKLDKFVSGKEQRIFKTDIRDINTENTFTPNYSNNLTYKQKPIFYAEYSPTYKLEYLNENSNYISGYLIDFHDINCDYIINRPDKYSDITISNPNSPWFSNAIYNAQHSEEVEKTNKITYFPEYIETPIDISISNNNSYLLLPLNNKKYTNIVQPNITLNNLDNSEYTALKPNYNEIYDELWSKPYLNSEDNSIPIYDVNFTFLQTINLGSHKNAVDWLTKHKLNTFITNDKETLPSLLLFNSETNTKDINGDSILIKELIDFLSEYNYLFSETTRTNILQDLIAQLDINSSVRFLSPIGHITEVNKKLVSSYTNNEFLNKDFINANIFNVNDCFYKSDVSDFEKYSIPENVLIGGDLSYGLRANANKKTTNSDLQSILFKKEDLPTAYFNILYLKNNRNPQYNFNYTIPESGYINGSTDYNIDLTNTLSPIKCEDTEDKNKDLNKLYDIDVTHSIEYNNIGTTTPNNFINKEITKELLEYASLADYERFLTDSAYSKDYPERLSNKIKDYLEPYTNRHICNNKLYNLGTLDGLRNYVRVGNITNNDKLWLSYKYNNVNLSELLELNNESFKLPFYEYNLNRIKHWTTDLYGNIITNQVMKPAEYECPWNNTNNANINNQALIGCKLDKESPCKGFCTFPCNSSLSVPSGYTWDFNLFDRNKIDKLDKTSDISGAFNNYGSSVFVIPSANFDRQLFVENDIYVNDDMEIHYTNNLSGTLELLKNATTLDTISASFVSLFQGFGGKNADKNYPQFKANYNSDYVSGFLVAKTTNFNSAHTITEGTLLSGYNHELEQTTDILKSGESCIIRVKNWWSDTIKCTGSIIAKPLISEGQLDNLSKILEDLTYYDYLEQVEGFFKYQQDNLHKSNIYSININNSGLNPENDLIENTETDKQKNKVRKQMRNILETAIRNSVSKYMPVETSLWKIEYTGK